MPAKKRPTGADPVEWAAYFWDERQMSEDPTPFLAMSSLFRYQRMVYLALETELKQFELNPTDYLLLMSLELSKDRTRLVGALARNLMVHATTATLAVDRLEGRGLLHRQAHPTDRRAILVTLTDKGLALVKKSSASLASIGFGLGDVRGADAKDLLRILTKVRSTAGDVER